MICKFTFLLLASISIVLVSCSGDATEQIKNERKKQIDFSRFSPFNLRPYGINVDIQLPDSTTVYGNSNTWRVEHELDEFDWKIILADDFKILIEDWGQENGIAHYSQQIEANEKAEVLEKSDSFLSYRLYVSDSNKELTKTHLFQQVNIDGIEYVFRTDIDGCSPETTTYIKTALKSMGNTK